MEDSTGKGARKFEDDSTRAPSVADMRVRQREESRAAPRYNAF